MAVFKDSLKILPGLVLSLVLVAPAWGQLEKASEGEPVCLTVFTRSVDIQGAMNISGWPQSAPGAECTSEIVEEPFILKPPPREGPLVGPGSLPLVYYRKSGLVVFNGPVRVSSGIAIGHTLGEVSSTRGEALFNGPVSIGSGLRAIGQGRAIFFNTVDIGKGGITLEGCRHGCSSLTFHGTVNIKGGRIYLSGDNSVVFKNEVRLESGGLIMDRTDSRASVTLAGPTSATARELKVLGHNRLVLSLSPSMAPEGFIQADSVELDADCLVIDSPIGLDLKEGAEIILITGWKIRLTGDNRKIITEQGDEFELLVGEYRILAKLTKLARPYVWYDNLPFDY